MIDGKTSKLHTGRKRGGAAVTCTAKTHLADSLGSSCGGWNDVAVHGASTTPVLFGWSVNSFLSGRGGMHRGHQASHNAKLVIDHLFGEWWGVRVRVEMLVVKNRACMAQTGHLGIRYGSCDIAPILVHKGGSQRALHASQIKCAH